MAVKHNHSLAAQIIRSAPLPRTSKSLSIQLRACAILLAVFLCACRLPHKNRVLPNNSQHPSQNGYHFLFAHATVHARLSCHMSTCYAHHQHHHRHIGRLTPRTHARTHAEFTSHCTSQLHDVDALAARARRGEGGRLVNILCLCARCVREHSICARVCVCVHTYII